MLKTLVTLLSLSAVVLIYHQFNHEKKKVEPVDIDFVVDLDIERFMGQWYVIANKPNLIEKHCRCARTLDTLLDANTIQLSETCWILG